MAANILDLDLNGNLNMLEYSLYIQYLLNVYNMTNSSLCNPESLNSSGNESCCDHLAGDHKICKRIEFSFGITSSSVKCISIENSFLLATVSEYWQAT
jgi:hypothetical protein